MSTKYEADTYTETSKEAALPYVKKAFNSLKRKVEKIKTSELLECARDKSLIITSNGLFPSKHSLGLNFIKATHITNVDDSFITGAQALQSNNWKELEEEYATLKSIVEERGFKCEPYYSSAPTSPCVELNGKNVLSLNIAMK